MPKDKINSLKNFYMNIFCLKKSRDMLFYLFIRFYTNISLMITLVTCQYAVNKRYRRLIRNHNDTIVKEHGSAEHNIYKKRNFL